MEPYEINELNEEKAEQVIYLVNLVFLVRRKRDDDRSVLITDQRTTAGKWEPVRIRRDR